MSDACNAVNNQLSYTFANILAPDENNHHKINAVTVHSFGSWQSRFVNPGLDPELMDF